MSLTSLRSFWSLPKPVSIGATFVLAFTTLLSCDSTTKNDQALAEAELYAANFDRLYSFIFDTLSEEEIDYFYTDDVSELKEQKAKAERALEAREGAAALALYEQAINDLQQFVSRVASGPFQRAVTAEGTDLASSIRQTADHGFILAGTTSSFGAGALDLFLAKLDVGGAEEWRSAFGGEGKDFASAVEHTPRSGYVVVGRTDSYKDWSGDVFLVKVNAEGAEEWSATFGKMGTDVGVDVVRRPAGGYVVAGRTFGGADGMDVFLAAVDDRGEEVWSKRLGGPGDDLATSLHKVDDGYVVTGGKGSLTAQEASPFAIRFDDEGKADEPTVFESVKATTFERLKLAPVGDGWLAAWETASGDSFVTTDAHAALLTSDGQEIWHDTIDGDRNETVAAILSASDGGAILVGTTTSYGAGGKDIFVVKYSENGERQWERTFGTEAEEEAVAAAPAFDGGFVVAANTGTFRESNEDILLIKADSRGRSWDKGPLGMDGLNPAPDPTSSIEDNPIMYEGPKIGEPAPPIDAQEWLNTSENISLESLRGKFVVVEFWATWCGPCKESTPHLVEIHEKYNHRGVVLVSLTDELRADAPIDAFMETYGVNYVVGVGSESREAYGVTGIPHAYILDREGVIQWRGHPMSNMEETLEELVNASSTESSAP